MFSRVTVASVGQRCVFLPAVGVLVVAVVFQCGFFELSAINCFAEEPAPGFAVHHGYLDGRARLHEGEFYGCHSLAGVSELIAVAIPD